jgi:ComEC/Rec2-related protein
MVRLFFRPFGNSADRFCGRHPLFVAALIAVGCVLAADRSRLLGAVAALCFGGIGLLLAGWRRGLVWILCGGVAVAVFCVKKESRAEAEEKLVGAAGVATGKILVDGRGTAGFWAAPTRLEEGDFRGTKVWWEGTGNAPVAGSVVRARGNFLKLQGPRNPEEFDEAAWHARKGVVAVFNGRTLTLETGKWAAFGARIRRGFRTAVTAGLDENSIQAGVIRAIVIGEMPPDADEVVAAFRNSGTLHIFSVSGMHVAMVGSIGWFVLRKLGLSRRKAVLAILPLVFGYAWISGNSAPAVRSAWMMAVFLMAFVFRRPPDLLNSLGAVLLAAMVWDGNLLFQPGVQLSYGVVAAIAVGTSWASRMFAWVGKREEYLPEGMGGWRDRWLRFRRTVALYLGVSMAAWVGSTPLTIYHFGLVTPVALIGTAVLTLPVYGLLTLALLSAAVHPILPVAAERVNRVNGKLADVCVGGAEFLAGIPGSHFSTRGPGKPMLLVYDLEYGAGAACFSGGKDGAVLIDCGDARAFKYRVARSLHGLGIEPDSVVLSHPDGGHLGGGAQVWQAFPIRQALLPVQASRSPDFREWLKESAKAGIDLIQAADIGSLAFPDDARLEILSAPEPASQNVLADDRVAVFRLHWRGWKLLLTSDAGAKTEARLLESGKDLSADVIVCGRHRADSSLGDQFLDAVNPRAIIASNSQFPREEHLDLRQAGYWKSRGIHVLNQRDTGGVTIRVEEETGDLLLEGFVDRSVVRLAK